MSLRHPGREIGESLLLLHHGAQRLAEAGRRTSRSRRLFWYRIQRDDTTMPDATMSTMMVARALTSGLTPSRTLEKMTMGSVLEPGPATNCEITRSSHDRVKASNQPDTSAGTINGSVILKKTFAGRAPRSMAASSSDSSKPTSRDCTTTVTYAMQNVMCASVIVTAPPPFGQPIACSNATNSSKSDKPV